MSWYRFSAMEIFTPHLKTCSHLCLDRTFHSKLSNLYTRVQKILCGDERSLIRTTDAEENTNRLWIISSSIKLLLHILGMKNHSWVGKSPKPKGSFSSYCSSILLIEWRRKGKILLLLLTQSVLFLYHFQRMFRTSCSRIFPFQEKSLSVPYMAENRTCWICILTENRNYSKVSPASHEWDVK